MSEEYTPSYEIGEGRDRIEFFSAYDADNPNAQNRISLNPRRFGISGIREIILHHLEINAGRTYYVLTNDREMLKVDAIEFFRAREATPRGRNEFIESISSIIAHAQAWSIEEPTPIIPESVIFLSDVPQKPSEAH